MINLSEAPETIRDMHVVGEGIVEDWPGKRQGDVAIVYMGLNGDSFAEDVLVTVVNDKGNPLIRHLEWGRPSFMKFVFACPATAALVIASLLPGQALSEQADALMQARSNCLTAVAKVVGLPRSSLSVIQHQSKASGFHLEVKVPKAVAPWACLTTLQGKVEDVHFKGSEGAL
jgi:hypothetical protein